MSTSLIAPAMQVRKRSGELVNYNKQKITQAVMLCLVNDCRFPQNEATKALAGQVTTGVEKTIKRAAGPIDVETIQDLVELHLLSLGHRDAAKQYILFRDERRKMREATTVTPEEAAIIQSDAEYFPTELSRFQHYNKYARYVDALGRRETAIETTQRDMDFIQGHLAKHNYPLLSQAEYDMLGSAILKSEAAPSMRLMQMAGPAAERCNAHIYNCCYAAVTDFDYMAEILYLSMCGTGNGFSVENQFVHQLPQIKIRRSSAKPDRFDIPDTTEGWCDSTKLLAHRLSDWHDVDMGYGLIRDAGTRLKTKGGTASGPQCLMDLHNAMRRIFRAQEGMRLRDIDVHDIMCYIGKVGQLGNVRRGALISLSDLASMTMASAKQGKFWTDPLMTQRTISNNSATYNVKPSPEVFMAEWLELVKSKSGERGIFNRGSIWSQIPKRRQQMYEHLDERVMWGVNPCGEVVLYPTGQMCNLSQGICRIDDTVESLTRKIEIASIFGTLQSTMTDFNYLRPVWKENCERERLLGVDLGGAMDSPLLRDSNPDRDNLLQHLRQTAIDTNVNWAQRLGINPSTAVTVIKPGGNSGARWNIGQSMSGWLAPHMIRYVEVSNLDPMCRFLKDAGVYHEISYRDPGTTVFGFPIKAPEGALIVADLVTDASGKVLATKARRSALDQLENWRTFKKHYTEHNPSVTIYVADDEWLKVGSWVYENWDDVGGLAFLPLDGGVYEQAPFTPVTEKQYDEYMARFPTRIPWEKLARYEDGRDHRDGEAACSAGVCEMRKKWE